MSRVGRIARGLVAAVALVALLGAVPAAMWRFVGWPLPHHVPSANEMRIFLSSSGMSIDVALDVLAIVWWPLWASFAVSTVTEALAAVRRRSVPRLPWVGGIQGLAAGLVATVVIAVSSLSLRGAGTPTPVRPLAAAVLVDHAVGPPDLWARLAVPGLPAAHPVPVAEHSGPRAGGVTVERGDTLWHIAGSRLGNPSRWPSIWAENEGRAEPGHRHFDNPNLIVPGWELRLPTLDVPAAPPHVAPAQDPAAASGPAPSTPAPALPQTPAPAPAPRPTAEPPSVIAAPDAAASSAFGAVAVGGSAVADRPVPPPAAGMTPSTPPDAAAAAQVGALGAAPWIGGATAIAISGLVGLALRHQRRRRRLGQRGDRAAEVLAATPVVAAALRRAPLPSSPEGVELVPMPGSDADTAQRCRQPGMIVLGRDAVGADVVANVRDLNGVAFVGAGAVDVVRAILVGYVVHHRVPGETRLIGSACELLDSISSGSGIEPSPQVDEGLRELQWAAVASQADSAKQPALAVIAAGELDAAERQRVATTVALASNGNSAMLVLGECDGCTTVTVDAQGRVQGPPLLGAVELMHMSSEEGATLVELAWSAQGIDPVEAPGEEVPDEGVLPPTATAPTGAPDEPVVVNVFGGVRLVAGGEAVRHGLRTPAIELLALLATRPDGVMDEEAMEIMTLRARGEKGTPGDLRQAAESARGAARKRGAPSTFLARTKGGHRLDPARADSDLWRFERAMRAAAEAAAPDERIRLLRAAADEVTGEPLAGATWEWALAAREGIRRRAVDCLEQLAEQQLRAEDLDGALETLERARALTPDAEDIYRRMITLLLSTQRPEAAARVFAQLEAQLAELGFEPEDETLALLARDDPAGGAVIPLRRQPRPPR